MKIKEDFAYWMEERERVRLRKESGSPKPWSADPVFQTTYFCNVNRENDRVTKEIRMMHKLGHGKAIELAAFNLTAARMVNKPESLFSMGWPFGLDSPWKKMFWKVMSQPGSWGSAYIVSTNGRAQPKHEYVLGLLEQAFEQLYGVPGAVLGGSLSAAHRRLQAVPGLGSFMAAQVIADLKNTTWHPLSDAEDWWSFAAPGPGSLRGLSRFHERRITPSNFTEALASARQWLHNNGYTHLTGWVCNQDLQNCFCEFSKYARVKTGEGRSKRRYNGV